MQIGLKEKKGKKIKGLRYNLAILDFGARLKNILREIKNG